MMRAEMMDGDGVVYEGGKTDSDVAVNEDGKTE